MMRKASTGANTEKFRGLLSWSEPETKREGKKEVREKVREDEMRDGEKGTRVTDA
jgi:hypothetical protein